MARQPKWSLEMLGKGMEDFKKMHGRYPTAEEFDEFPNLPTSRTIQRSFGGLVQLRSALGIKDQHDYRRGVHSSERARTINKRAHEVEQEVHAYLVDRFGVEFVHREYFFTDDRRRRTDFFVYCANGNFSVDVFYPKNRHSLIGCLNSKLRTYGSGLMLQYPVIFLQMNREVPSQELHDVVQQKKNKLKPYQQVMCFEEFQQFCSNKKACRLRIRN